MEMPTFPERRRLDSMDSDNKVMLYLYKDIGLFWERTLSSDDNRDMCSMATNKGLRTFFNKQNSIIYNITNAKDMHKKPIEDNQFYFTDAKSSIIRSLVYHLRNSIMHGLYPFRRKAILGNFQREVN
jgi:hypothetical protein